MQTLGALAQSLTWSFYLLSTVVFSLALYRAKSIFFQRTDRYAYSSLTQKKWLRTIKILYAISWLLFLFGIPNALFITSAFRRIIPEHVTLLIWTSFMLMGIIEIIGCLSFSKSLINNKLKQAFLILSVLLVGYNAVKQMRVGTQLFNYPPLEDSLVLSFPLKGSWSASEAGGSTLSNDHQILSAQRYGIDLVKLNEEGSFFQRDGEALLDHLAFGASVYAPASGKVITVIDSLPNSKISLNSFTTDASLGNHIVIEIKPNQFLYLAHLDSGSIQTKKGDQVNEGDFLGRVGNSGTSKWPHLHLHVQDRESLFDEDASGFPIRFDALVKKRWFEWQQVKNGFLLRNDIVKAKSD